MPTLCSRLIQQRLDIAPNRWNHDGTVGREKRLSQPASGDAHQEDESMKCFLTPR